MTIQEELRDLLRRRRIFRLYDHEKELVTAS